MGGHLIMDIVEAGLPKLKTGYELILSPQSDVPEVRKFLREKGISILDEEMLVENGKYYNILKCVVGATDEVKDDTIDICDSLTKEEKDDLVINDMFGKALIEKKSPVLKQYLLSEIEKKQKIYCSLNKHCSGAPEEAPENILERLSEIDREIYLMGNTIRRLQYGERI
jgi:tRNA (adenine22-N1)-methyltransferase